MRQTETRTTYHDAITRIVGRRFWKLPWFTGLKHRHREFQTNDLLTLAPLFLPVIGMIAALGLGSRLHPAFKWAAHPLQYPPELWIVILSGLVATLGGVGDWLFHRVFQSVGPAEHHSHLLALATGGAPLFALMAFASVAENPTHWLLPIIVLVVYTTVLICYDEFVFHRRRCLPVETLLHRMIVFGHGTAWLAWMHWIFVV